MRAGTIVIVIIMYIASMMAITAAERVGLHYNIAKKYDKYHLFIAHIILVYGLL